MYDLFMLHFRRHNPSFWIASLWSARPQGWRLAIMALLTASLMAMALSVTTQAELAIIADGNVTGFWQFWAFLLAGAVLSGFGAGVVEATRFEDLKATVPETRPAAFIQNQLSCHVESLVAHLVNAPAAALTVVARISQRLRTLISLPLLTPDLWPTGASPRIIYESA